MILSVDVHYKEDSAKAVGLLFDRSDETITTFIEQINLNDIEAIIIDGYAYVDNNKAFGLGAFLWEALEEKIPVIGVAKTSFYKNKETVTALYRGESKNPLYISLIGYAK
ncbi:hypothetical protein [Mucilaginibacter aquaedulcis]|uniref:hypothetical protein n=1 Tax=Mucilaginibacter aquaedulcis TaxID=1187081 RepID=UPI0025B4BBF5|nr:hypothetical protein [Mucilaginibacter aquaedulcis]MDN3548820.1 hypothetical protein [Mucilaginibacter aquaedulcis]